MKKALKRMTAVVLLTLSVFLTGEAFAQTTVVGRVVDTNNVPLIGVNVVVKGTTTGTTTGIDGNYSIKVGETQTLVFSYLGYTTVEEVVGKRTTINVKWRRKPPSWVPWRSSTSVTAPRRAAT